MSQNLQTNKLLNTVPKHLRNLNQHKTAYHEKNKKKHYTDQLSCKFLRNNSPERNKLIQKQIVGVVSMSLSPPVSLKTQELNHCQCRLHLTDICLESTTTKIVFGATKFSS